MNWHFLPEVPSKRLKNCPLEMHGPYLVVLKIRGHLMLDMATWYPDGSFPACFLPRRPDSTSEDVVAWIHASEILPVIVPDFSEATIP